MEVITDLWWVWSLILIVDIGYYALRFIDAVASCCISTQVRWDVVRPRFGLLTAFFAVIATILLVIPVFVS